MSAIRGTVQSGQFVPDGPIALPDGARAELRLVTDDMGVCEEEQGTDPASNAAWLAWLDTLEPFLTPEEEAEWHRDRAEHKARELARWDERNEELGKLFE